ncbi:MAG: hypothetical protein HKM89_05480 [Gemmatimonadales bacterium]|nr:hypothetical protein [Gemmatimonadales bacterium]
MRILRAGPSLVLVLAGVSFLPPPGHAQERIDRGQAVASDARFKIWAPAGSVRMEAWDRDSLHIAGTVEHGKLYSGGGRDAMKVMVEDLAGTNLSPTAHLVIQVPRGAQVSVKTVTAPIEATAVTGWFNSISGDIRLGGTARRLEAETLDGSITLQAEATWVRVRTGSGAITLEGRYRDLRTSSVSGPIRVLNKEVERGRIESVTGDIHYAGRFMPEGAVDFDTHSGTVTLELPNNVAGHLSLTSIGGSIENNLTADQPAPAVEGAGEELVLRLGGGGAAITVRSFKGTIRLVRM